MLATSLDDVKQIIRAGLTGPSGRYAPVGAWILYNASLSDNYAGAVLAAAGPEGQPGPPWNPETLARAWRGETGYLTHRRLFQKCAKPPLTQESMSSHTRRFRPPPRSRSK